MAARVQFLPHEPGWDASLAGRLAAGEEAALIEPLSYLADGRPPASATPADAGARRELAAALAAANGRLDHPRTEELAGRLADPATRVVVAGQQPGLFGGPLMTLYKMLAAARWAERLGEGGPAVALFWVASEDHDFREVAEAVIAGRRGLRRIGLGDDEEPLVPIGRRRLGEGIEAALAAWGEEATGPRYEEWIARVRGWYRPEARFGEAFGRLMVDLLGGRAPLLVDALDPTLKRLEAPWLRRLVERRREVGEALERADSAVEKRGYRLQVRPQPGASPLFLLDGGERRRVEWRDGDRFTLRSRDGSDAGVDALLAMLDEEPGRVSPGVLARPLVQDAVLGTALQVIGPGELAYLSQAAPLYEVLDVPAPAVVLRPRALLVEAHQLGHLEELGLDLEALAAGELDLERHLAVRAGAGDLESEAAGELEPLLDRLRERALTLDPNLERPWEKTRDQVHKAISTFAGKVARAAAGRDEVERRRAEALAEACRPLGRPQERVLAAAHFRGKYGSGFVDTLWDELELAGGGIQVVTLGEEA